jgi:RNA polymerase sigma factor (sigma-70 family)
MGKADPRQLLTEVFSAQRGRLYHFLRRRLANEADAQELSQEAYLRLLRVPRPEFVQNAEGYLFGIARNLVYELSHKGPATDGWAEEWEMEALSDPRPTLEDSAERARRLELVEDAVRNLPAACRAAMLLLCRDGLNQREIAERLGISKSMAQRHIAMGLAQCRKRLRRFRDGQER